VRDFRTITERVATMNRMLAEATGRSALEIA